MKNPILLLVIMLSVSLNVSAQGITVEEPDFAEETLLLLSDTQGETLAREDGFFQTSRGWTKGKTLLVLSGIRSKSYTAKGKSTTRLIVKAKDNLTDPHSFINIFKFEVKSDDRRYTLSESSMGGKFKTNNLSSINFNAKKYGESSYLITLNGLTPGEYGIIIGDPNTTNTKNGWKVTTFAVE